MFARKCKSSNVTHGHGSICIILKNNHTPSQVQFQADEQVVAACITMNDKTYCNFGI